MVVLYVIIIIHIFMSFLVAYRVTKEDPVISSVFCILFNLFTGLWSIILIVDLVGSSIGKLIVNKRKRKIKNFIEQFKTEFKIFLAENNISPAVLKFFDRSISTICILQKHKIIKDFIPLLSVISIDIVKRKIVIQYTPLKEGEELSHHIKILNFDDIRSYEIKPLSYFKADGFYLEINNYETPLCVALFEPEDAEDVKQFISRLNLALNSNQIQES